jgi:hypothetical protein
MSAHSHHQSALRGFGNARATAQQMLHQRKLSQSCGHHGHLHGPTHGTKDLGHHGNQHGTEVLESARVVHDTLENEEIAGNTVLDAVPAEICVSDLVLTLTQGIEHELHAVLHENQKLRDALAAVRKCDIAEPTLVEAAAPWPPQGDHLQSDLVPDMATGGELLSVESSLEKPQHQKPDSPVTQISNGSMISSMTSEFRSIESIRAAVAEAGNLVTETIESSLEPWVGQVGKSLWHHHQIFADPEKMKDAVRQAILNPYVVTQHYHPSGFCQHVAAHRNFEIICSSVIGFNALWLSFDIDLSAGEAFLDKHVIFQIGELFFFIFFILEWAIRFGAFRTTWGCLSDGWFIFDSILIALMIVDTIMPVMMDSGGSGGTSMLRLVRLVKITRMARVAKALRNWPELTVLIKGMSIAARSVLSTLFLLGVLVYVFSMAFRQLTDETEVGHDYFRSIPYGMKVLILEAAVPDNIDIIDALVEEHILLGILGIIFFALVALTVMNMLIGMLCENIGVVSAVEKESLKVTFVKEEILKALRESNCDVEEDFCITKKEFQQILQNPIAAKAIRTVGVDPVGLVDFCDFIFSGDCYAMSRTKLKEGLSFPQLIELILEMGGANSCRVKDIIDLRKVLLRKFGDIDIAFKRQSALTQQLFSSIVRREGNYQNRSDSRSSHSADSRFAL